MHSFDKTKILLIQLPLCHLFSSVLLVYLCILYAASWHLQSKDWLKLCIKVFTWHQEPIAVFSIQCISASITWTEVPSKDYSIFCILILLHFFSLISTFLFIKLLRKQIQVVTQKGKSRMILICKRRKNLKKLKTTWLQITLSFQCAPTDNCSQYIDKH